MDVSVFHRKLHSWALKLEFHVIFTCHKSYFSLDCFQPFKDVKPLLGLWDVHKWVVGQICPTGHSLLALLQIHSHPRELEWEGGLVLLTGEGTTPQGGEAVAPAPVCARVRTSTPDHQR